VFYAHASVGELHLRPVIDIKKWEGLQKMKAMAEEIAVLVRKYRGSLSGEHGDGRARAPYIEKVLGREMMPLLQQVKGLWDPDNLFNPGKIVNPRPIDEHLRFSPGHRQPEVDTTFNWQRERGFGEALELCNGAGVCRKLAESGGTMCPSYMVTREEKDSTRGRANLFRQLFAGRGREAFASEELRDALDLCISCKGCKSECPANVDMAKMKAEFMHGWHQRYGMTLSERFFAQAGRLYPLAGKMPTLANWLMRTPVAKELLFQFAGVHRKRTLPAFADEPFFDWFTSRSKTHRSDQKLVLLVDIFTNYFDPQIARSAVRVLEALGYEVLVPGIIETGRPQISKGMLDQARRLANANIRKLHPYTSQNIPVVGLEPSEVLTLRDEYLDLNTNKTRKMASMLANRTYQFEEFFSHHLLDHPEKNSLFDGKNRQVHLHGHCHAKALAGNEVTLEALKSANYSPSDLKTGCCGMAGSFGYESDHYEVSMNIGELTLFPALRDTDPDSLICAPGFSCRHQIADGTGRRAYHPAELIHQAMRSA
jgi:Fe-S oxidoreductase